MQRSFDLLEKVAGFVVVESGFKSEGPGDDLKRLKFDGSFGGFEAGADGGVDRFPKRFARSLHFGFQACRDVVIEGDCRSHIMMFIWMHHDVNRLSGTLIPGCDSVSAVGLDGTVHRESPPVNAKRRMVRMISCLLFSELFG